MRQPLRAAAHRCQRGRGQHEQAEYEQEGQDQPGHDGPDGRHDGCGGHPADHAAASGHGISTIARSGRTHDQVPDADHADEDRGSADHQASGGRVVVWVPQEAPGQAQQDERRQPGEGSDERGDDHARPRDEPAIDAEPGGCHESGGAGDQGKAQAIATVRRVEVAGTAAERTRSSAHEVGGTQPDRPQQPPEGGKCTGHRPRSHRLSGRGLASTRRGRGRSAGGLGGSAG